MKQCKRAITLFMVMVLCCFSEINVSAQTEAYYYQTGSDEVSDLRDGDFTIFYPKDIAGSTKKLPVITWGNGTACKTCLYNSLLKHFASHGYVVIATDQTFNKSGEDMLAAVDKILSLNAQEDSVFYQKIAVDRIGAAGHSQGGGGCVNCAKDTRIKAIAAIAPIKIDTAGVQCPMFLMSGEKDAVVLDSLFVTPMYEQAETPVVYGMVKGALHTTCMTSPDTYKGYVTAWFDWQLKGDKNAAVYFAGDNYLLANDSSWKNVKKKNF